MQYLWTKMEKIANKIVMGLIHNDSFTAKLYSSRSKKISGGSAISLHIHNRSIIHDISRDSTLKHDILRTMIRNAICSHFLCLHICHGASRFCAYSKNGWVSFPIQDEAIMATFGDQIQVNYKIDAYFFWGVSNTYKLSDTASYNLYYYH